MNYKPYPKYKESGVAWLGEVPEGWEIKRLKYIAKVNLSNVDKKKFYFVIIQMFIITILLLLICYL